MPCKQAKNRNRSLTSRHAPALNCSLRAVVDFVKTSWASSGFCALSASVTAATKGILRACSVILLECQSYARAHLGMEAIQLQDQVQECSANFNVVEILGHGGRNGLDFLIGLLEGLLAVSTGQFGRNVSRTYRLRDGEQLLPHFEVHRLLV